MKYDVKFAPPSVLKPEMVRPVVLLNSVENAYQVFLHHCHRLVDGSDRVRRLRQGRKRPELLMETASRLDGKDQGRGDGYVERVLLCRAEEPSECETFLRSLSHCVADA